MISLTCRVYRAFAGVQSRNWPKIEYSLRFDGNHQ